MAIPITVQPQEFTKKKHSTTTASDQNKIHTADASETKRPRHSGVMTNPSLISEREPELSDVECMQSSSHQQRQ